MDNNDLHKWISHRADMLFVCLKSLVLLTVGTAIVVALGDLSDSGALSLSVAVGAIGLLLWFCAFGAVMDIAAMRHDMSDDLKTSAFGSQFSKAPFPVYIGLTTIVMLGVPVMLIIALNN
jgi:hypothetical protein